MKIIICDNELNYLKLISNYIKSYYLESDIEIELITFQDEYDLLRYCEAKKSFDIIILDIFLKKLSGIEVARKLNKLLPAPKIIFLTATDKFALESYSVNATKYLIKPITYKDFKTELNQLMYQITNKKSKYFLEKKDDVVSLVYIDEIIYIETFNRKSLIHTTSQDILSTKYMKEHEKILNDIRFCRCHAAYIVNLEYILKVEGLNITLKNGNSISVSKNKKVHFMKQLEQLIYRHL